jgi:predicted transcriptional regulator of viral defense system
MFVQRGLLELLSHVDLLKKILRENKGIITAAQATDAGVPRRCLTEMAEAGEIYKVERGIYATPSVWEDEMYFLQYRFGRGIFSHGTALYLHSMTDRTPHVFTMTFPFGYNLQGVKKHGVSPKLAVPGLYELGMTEILSPCGNPLRVYDIEKTLCDIIRGGRNGSDIQLVSQAMKIYAASRAKNLAKLMGFAEKLRVKSKMLTYMEVLL